MDSTFFTDALFNSQWYLVNTGQRGGPSRLDLNVAPAWAQGFDGSGIRVAINDDGMDLSHPDLVANIDASAVFDTNRGTTGEGYVGTDNAHGTVVGSIVGMSAGNGQGGVGVAYKATLLPALAIGTTVERASAQLFLSNLSNRADVSVNSWGSDPAFTENFGASGSADDQAWGAALLKAATEGRGGKGMVIEVSAGNERGNRADAGLSNFTNNKVTIAVGAVDENGVATDYSTPGASLLVTAFGGVGSAEPQVDSGFGIASADIQSGGGYNTLTGDDGNYAYQNQGTSYSGPMVGAAAALILQARPDLGFRDVSSILALTARQTDAANASWLANGTGVWNLGGMHFSRDYGYGLIDIAAAVRLAQSWMPAPATAANWQVAESGPTTAVVFSIPDDPSRPLTVSAQVERAVTIDRMEFDLTLTATSPSQLRAEVTSPAGTTVTLFDQPLTRLLVDGQPDPKGEELAWPNTFTLGSTAFWGESSVGAWTLRLTDLVTGEVAQFDSWRVRAWGSTPSDDTQYVFTNEFSGQRTLSDAKGVDTLNAAAVAQAVRLDASGATASTVGAGSFTLSPGTVVEDLIGGAGDDTLLGQAGANRLRGNAGNDRLDGGAGIDTAVYSGTRAELVLSRDAEKKTITVSSPTAGTDTLINIERLQVGSTLYALDLDGFGGQAYRLYQAAFDRKPDLGGLGFYIWGLDTGVVSLLGAAGTFFNSAEFKALYGDNASNERFTELLYRNVHHRAPDAGGLDFWIGALENRDGAYGRVYSRAEVFVAFSESPENKANLVGVLQEGVEYTPYLPG